MSHEDLLLLVESIRGVALAAWGIFGMLGLGILHRAATHLRPAATEAPQSAGPRHPARSASSAPEPGGSGVNPADPRVGSDRIRRGVDLEVTVRNALAAFLSLFAFLAALVGRKSGDRSPE